MLLAISHRLHLTHLAPDFKVHISVSAYAHACNVCRAVPAVFPAYIRSTSWKKAHFLKAVKMPCIPVQKGATKVGAWIVLQSVGTKRSGYSIDANAIVRRSVRLTGVPKRRRCLCGTRVVNEYVKLGT